MSSAFINQLAWVYALFALGISFGTNSHHAVLVSFSFVAGAPIQIQKLEYMLKDYDFLETQGQIAVITAQLDQLAYVSRSCSPSPVPSTHR
jgi:hypothetical protein